MALRSKPSLACIALELALPVAEIETPYYTRPEGSFSKLNTWRTVSGFRTILKLYRSERPLRVFTVIGALLGWCRFSSRSYHCHLLRGGYRSAITDRGTFNGPEMILSGIVRYVGACFRYSERGRREMKLLA